MPRLRTPPPLQPNGWEKTCFNTHVGCTMTERLLWQSVFGRGKISEVARDLLNREAYRRANIPVEAVAELVKGAINGQVKIELKRHAERLLELNGPPVARPPRGGKRAGAGRKKV